MHELRTPLQSIQGFAELLGPNLDPERLHRYLRIIQTEAERLEAVVDDLSQRSRISLGALDLHRVAIAVQPFLAQLCRDFELQYPGWHVALQAGARLPDVLADLEHLRQVLWTLLRNAGRYSMDTADSTVRLIAHTSAPSSNVRFIVMDTGARIPVAYREVIFEPSPRLARPVGSRPRSGLGTGLYVARELARRMGGDLTLASSPRNQGGNAFVLSVPVASDVKPA